MHAISIMLPRHPVSLQNFLFIFSPFAERNKEKWLAN